MPKPSGPPSTTPSRLPARNMPRPGASSTRIGTLVQQSPLLAQLTQQAKQSNQLLEAIKPLLPMPLRTLVRAGPIEGEEWCVIVPNSAAAAKFRHLAPVLLAELAARGEAGAPVIHRIRARVGR